MKNILLFGAGKSATVLIDYLLHESEKNNWKVLIADADKKTVDLKINGHPNAEAFGINILEDQSRLSLIEDAHIVISMMPPALHIRIAKDCVALGKNLLTASYADDDIKALEQEIKDKGLLFLCEMGLDPGIDHMSAMQILDELKESGAVVNSFKSHCGGLVAPESDDNPWHYKISWNPRNIVLPGKSGAVYKYENKIITENYTSLFNASRVIETGNAEVPVLSYYPNRNSLPYINIYGLEQCETFVRTTLRYNDFMFGWKNIIDLNLTDEQTLYDTDGRTLHDFFREHLINNGFSDWLQEKLSDRFVQTKDLLQKMKQLIEAEENAKISGTDPLQQNLVVDKEGILKTITNDEIKEDTATLVAKKMHEAELTLNQLLFLGMDDHETFINRGKCSPADVLQFALEKKLALQNGDKDMIVMVHEIEYSRADEKGIIHSSLFVIGDDNIRTAMAKTVGLPLGIAAKLILNGTIQITGLHIPVIREIYTPVLEELKNHGIVFSEHRKLMP